MLKGVLLFLAGLLVGANLVYFLMTRHAAMPGARVAVTSGSADPATAAATAPTAGSTDATPATNPVPAEGAPPAPTRTATPTSAATPSSISVARPGGLLLPVRGVRADQLVDTYSQTRGGTRIHEALDIMAPRGTAVLAVADGKVEKLFTSNAGGLTVYQFDPTGTYAYYYAHLERYAPGLKEGQQVRRGDVIGEVGSTGNANPDAPHLHFAIFRLGPERRWWEGTPINPYPLLAGD